MKKEKQSFIASITVIAIIVLGIILAISVAMRAKPKQPATQKPSQESLLANLNKQENKAALDESGDSNAMKVRPIEADDHIWGNPNAPVQIIIYSDFECPFCTRFADTIKQVENEFKDKVAVAFRNFPLSTIHPEAMQAAEAAECAADQNKFWEMHDKLFADNRDGTLSQEQARKDAEDLKLDMTKYDKCVASETYIDKINNQMLEARNLGVVGTPATFLNGIFIPGAHPFEDYKDADGNPVEGLKNLILKLLK